MLFPLEKNPLVLRQATRQALEENWPHYCGHIVASHDAVCVAKAGHAGEHEYADSLMVKRLGCGNWREASGR